MTIESLNKPDAANECRAGLLASSDVGRAALIADLGGYEDLGNLGAS
jgi:hypothetical protein